MVRYFYFFVLLNMISNVIILVPKVLIEHRFDSATIGLVTGFVIGTILMFLFVRFMKAFPEEGLPEILQKATAPWFFWPFLFINALMFFFAGAITLIGFSTISVRFINPEISTTQTLLLFLLLVGWIASRKSIALIFTVELLFLINIPLILIIYSKAFSSATMDWVAVKEVISSSTYTIPSYSTVAAASYLFSGYTNFLIFNRYMKKEFIVRVPWLIPITGFITLVTTFFIPIGFYGTDAVGDLTFPWISSADSIRFEYGIVERVVFMFLTLYISISLLSACVHWHVSIQLFQSLFEKTKFFPLKKTLVLLLFCTFTIWYNLINNEQDFVKASKIWLNIRFATEFVSVIILLVLAKRGKTNE
ncbi:hypothetical protein EDM56_30535 [Brevibacillus fluminis]|uniref:Uncharacterized protein n=1 Tax=Brevibacillus fluminis TaxID=511487 RepID=A0A3M8CRW8_9BACL|nr:GerAB/ArcD/ProY family transporter [Brevibacillus fluminis]RNB78536.1 hypothetical protein EDM56_30535 [Brevibacillus fluminis]